MARHGHKKANKGGGRGGARGGGHGAKRGGRGGSKKHGGGSQRKGPGDIKANAGDFQGLFDFNDSMDSSMAATARRTKGRRSYGMQNEAFQTQENRDTVIFAPCRKRPVEFVMATLYDPTKELIVRLAKKEKEQQRSYGVILNGDDQARPVEVEVVVLKDQDILNDTNVDTIADKTKLDMDVVDSEEEMLQKQEPEVIERTMEVEKETKILIEINDEMQGIPDDQLFFIDDEGEKPTDIKTIIVEDPKIKKPRRGPKPNNLEFDPVLSIGHVHLPTKFNQKGQYEAYLPKVGNKNKNLKSFNPTPQRDLEFSSDEYEINYAKKGTDMNMYQSYNNYISRVLQNMDNLNSDEEEDDDEEEDQEQDQEQAEEEANFLAQIEEELETFKETSGYYKEDKLNTKGNPFIEANDSMGKLKITEAEDPEFGYLAEDFESFDPSILEIINIRFGASTNQYFMRSFKLLGDNEQQWIDGEILSEYLLECGLPEHRLNAYFKHIHDLIAPPEPEIPVISNYEQIPFSDSDSEDDYDERNYSLSEDDDEGLADLINYTKKYDGLRDMDIEPTQSLKTRGKGRKKELDLDHIVDMELRQSLADQFQIRRASKKTSKSTRDSNIEREHANSTDLLLKYPFSFHVKDIRNEFESFLHDSKRNALTFPPMDVHAIKTIGKFAYYYNMKHRKFGNGLKMHGVVVKNKRTFHSLPDYHSIGELMKQRRVFNRTDQKRPRTEIEQEEAKSSRRGNPSKAFLKSGDVVGANAPEIAGDNIGRRLLMKMGWSSGQGLGLDNRGVPEPVVAIVKNNKAGLR